MRIGAYSVLDNAAGAFGHPFFMPAQGLAIRMFGEWCRNKDTPLGKHPADFRLYRVGWFDDETCEFGKDDEQFTLISSGTDHVQE